MIFNQNFTTKKAPNKWFWSTVFLISLAGLSYLGLNPVLIEDWWWVLVSYNVLMGGVAIYYIVHAISKLKRDNKSGVVGTRFTWSFVKIIPILVIMPVLSFYMFSFQTIQDNVNRSHLVYNNFNKRFVKQVDELYSGVQEVRDSRYRDFTKVLLQQIESYSRFQNDPETYQNKMQVFIQGLVDNRYACSIVLTNEKDELIAEASQNEVCVVEDIQPLSKRQTFVVFEDETKRTVEVHLSSYVISRKKTIKSMNIVVVYGTDPHLLNFLSKVKSFTTFVKSVEYSFNVNTSLTQKNFLLDFSSTILLTILSVLLIVFRMIDQLMRPMHNLSVASKEIASGNYDVLVHNQEESEDMLQLIGQFNEMAKQIKASRQGLDTHNLYLETILKYSFGVIGLDKDRNIQLINPMIGKILAIDNEQQYIGSLCLKISEKYTSLKPLFLMALERFEQEQGEWSEEVELTLPNRHVLLSCQGAALDISGKALGYVIIIKDISKLNRAQKKAAWGEVAVRMAHEIKNPLTPILLSAQRLRNRFLDTLKGRDLEIIDKTTNVIIDQVKSMDAMVSAFADYANTPQIERKLTDLNALINQSIALYDAHSNITIEFDLSGNVPKLYLDANSISRVLINLVKNSAESVVEGCDLTVNVATQYLPSEGVVRLTITDDGDGFDEEVIERLFEPYVTTKVKGSGLGMAIVRNIIEQHDGRIFASNAEPNGAIVTIEFEYKKENL
jgi:nitrogen fixation/metabolism regulation signal transduction histidine kinase